MLYHYPSYINRDLPTKRFTICKHLLSVVHVFYIKETLILQLHKYASDPLYLSDTFRVKIIDMIKGWLFSLKEKERKIVQLVAESFTKNERILSIIREETGATLSKRIHMLVAYAYLLVKRTDGVFGSKNETSFIFYYRNKQLNRSCKDGLRYLYLAVFIIGMRKVIGIINREKKIKEIRLGDQKQSGHKDFLYVWFLAQAKTYNALDSLMETKRFIMDKADYLNIPIYMETTEERLVPLYARMGFKFYDSHIESDYTIYFAKYEPYLYEMSKKIAA